MKRVIIFISVLATVGVFAASAFAASIEGSSSGIFIDPIGPGGMITSGVGTSNFTWGIDFGTGPSSLSFTGNIIATEFDTLFSFGTLDYFNGTIFGGTEANSVDLSVNLNLTLPTGLSQNFDYTLELINTLNTGDPIASADFVVFPTTFPDATFSIGGTSYTLAFSGFGNISGGGFSEVNQFHVLEGSAASAELVGTITEHVSQVPEPSTLLLLGSGLVSLGFWGRKRFKERG